MLVPDAFTKIVKQYEKQINKDQWHKPDMSYTKEDFYKKVSEEHSRVFTRDEIEQIFWDKLVHLGWRIQSHETIGGKGEVITLILTCPECDGSIDFILKSGLNLNEITKISNKSYVSAKLIEHKASSKGCKPYSEDEAISEATPEAIQVGTIEWDAATNSAQVMGADGDWIKIN